jgi:NAD+ synthase (glutamine-hydrolysing)
MAIPGYLLGDTWEQQSFLRDCEACGWRCGEAGPGHRGDVRQRSGGLAKKTATTVGRARQSLFYRSRRQILGGDNFPYPFRVKTLQPNYREFDDTRYFTACASFAGEMGSCRWEELLQP